MPNIIYAKDFVQVGDVLTRIIDENSREFVYDLWSEVVDATPVCSGKAAWSWWISPNIAKTKDRLPQPRFVPGRACKRMWNNPKEEGRYAATSTNGKLMPEYSSSHSTWIINNTAPYVHKLNAGSSHKAPKGFVETALAHVIAKYRR